MLLLLVGCSVRKTAGFASVDPDFVAANQLAQEGKIAQSLPHYEAALQRDSGNPVYLYYYSLALVRAGDTAGALNALDRVLRANPGDALAADMAGQLMRAQGRYARSLEVYDKLASTNPMYESMARIRQAELYMLMEKADSAFASASSVLTRSPFNAEAWYLLAGYYAEKNDEDKAISCLEKAFELDPDLKQKCAQDTLFNSLRDNPLFKWMTE